MTLQKFNTNRTIWVLEDDANDRFVYEKVLASRYKVSFIETLAQFKLKCQEEELPELIIADLGLADGNFFQFLTLEKDFRERATKFIVVSADSDLDVLRACFEEGALDYLTKPFDKNELIVKVERYLDWEDEVVPLSIVPPGAVANLFPALAKSPVKNLTAKEFQIFHCLYKSIGRPVCRSEILQEVWSDTAVGDKTLDVHLFHIRRKLTGTGLHIEFQKPNFFILTKL